MSHSSTKPHGPEGTSNAFSPSSHLNQIIDQLNYHFHQARSLDTCSNTASSYATKAYRKNKKQNRISSTSHSLSSSSGLLLSSESQKNASNKPCFGYSEQASQNNTSCSCCSSTFGTSRRFNTKSFVDRRQGKKLENNRKLIPTRQHLLFSHSLEPKLAGNTDDDSLQSTPKIETNTAHQKHIKHGCRHQQHNSPTAIPLNHQGQPPNCKNTELKHGFKCECVVKLESLDKFLSMGRPRHIHQQKKQENQPFNNPNHVPHISALSLSEDIKQELPRLQQRLGTAMEGGTSTLDALQLRKKVQHLNDDEKLTVFQSQLLDPYKRSKLSTLETNVLSLFSDQFQSVNREGDHIQVVHPHHPRNGEKPSEMFGCSHYARNCKLKAKCCGLFVSCRFCHDEAMCGDHEMDRFEVDTVLCMLCLTEQPISPKCMNCDISFGHYYCNDCKFLDNTPGKKIYHCNKCNICRVGEGLGIDNFHCDKCDSCVSLKSRDHHQCRKDSLRSNCPICAGYLFTSRDPVVYMKCGHSMHSSCFDEYISRSYQCPLCMRSLTDMSAHFKRLDEIVSNDTIPEEYLNKKSLIFCNDCSLQHTVKFHFDYHKCGNEQCGSYNTKVLKTLDTQNQENEPFEKEVMHEKTDMFLTDRELNQCRNDDSILPLCVHEADEEMIPLDEERLFQTWQKVQVESSI